MSYSYTVGTFVGNVRLWIQDNVEARAAFSNEEITEVGSLYSDDVRQTAAAMLIILASNKAKLAKRKSAGKYSEDLTQVAKELREQAKAILDGAAEPYETEIEQTFGPLDKPWEGQQEKEFIDRDNLRNS